MPFKLTPKTEMNQRASIGEYERVSDKNCTIKSMIDKSDEEEMEFKTIIIKYRYIINSVISIFT
jgi:hypothetical protein